MSFRPIVIILAIESLIFAILCMAICRAQTSTFVAPDGAVVTYTPAPASQPSTQPVVPPTTAPTVDLPTDPKSKYYDPAIPLVAEPDGTVGFAGIAYTLTPWDLALQGIGALGSNPIVNPVIDPTKLLLPKAIYWSSSAKILGPQGQTPNVVGTSLNAAEIAAQKAGCPQIVICPGSTGMIADAGWNLSGSGFTQLAIITAMGAATSPWATGQTLNISGPGRCAAYDLIDPGPGIAIGFGDSYDTNGNFQCSHIWIQRCNVSGNGASIALLYGGSSLTYAPDCVVIAACQVHDVWGGTGQRAGIYIQQIHDCTLFACSEFNCEGGIPPGNPKADGFSIYNQGVYVQSSASQPTSNVPINLNQPSPNFRILNFPVSGSGNLGIKDLYGGVLYGIHSAANPIGIQSNMYPVIIANSAIEGGESSFGPLVIATGGSSGNPFNALAMGPGGTVAAPTADNEGGGVSLTTTPQAYLWRVAWTDKSAATPNHASLLNVNTVDANNGGNDPPQSSRVYLSNCYAPNGWFYNTFSGATASLGAAPSLQTSSTTNCSIIYNACELLGLAGVSGNDPGPYALPSAGANLGAWANSIGVSGNSVDGAKALTGVNPQHTALEPIAFDLTGLEVSK